MQNFVFSKRALVRTRVGDWLLAKGLLAWLILTLLLVFILIFFSRIGSTSVEITDGRAKLYAVRPGRLRTIVLSALNLIAYFLYAHLCNRELFYYVIKTFDVIIMMCSQVLMYAMYVCNLYLTFGSVFDVEWQVMHFVFLLSIQLPAAVFWPSIDCALIGFRPKLSICVVLNVCCVSMYVGNRYFWAYWGDASACIQAQCPFSLKKFFLSALAQVIVFMSKAIIAYG